MEGEDRLRRIAHTHQRIERQPPLLEACVHARLGIGRQLAGGAPAVGKEAQRTARGDGGIELAQGARRRVPGVGEHLGAGLGLLGVELLEIVVAQIDLAAHLDQLRDTFAGESAGDIAHRHDVGRHVLALGAVAPRRRLHQARVLVGEGDREPIDLRLGRQLDGSIGAEAQEATDAGDEIDHVLLAEGVAERKHRHAVADLAEGRDRSGADPQGRAVVAHERRKARLDGCVALA